MQVKQSIKNLIIHYLDKPIMLFLTSKVGSSFLQKELNKDFLNGSIKKQYTASKESWDTARQLTSKK